MDDILQADSICEQSEQLRQKESDV